jgi:hypothetical protein
MKCEAAIIKSTRVTARHIRLAILRVVLICLTFSFTGCTLRSTPQPSVLVIFVEGLGFGLFSCADGAGMDQLTGFKTFCDESVRFTHAYAPSALSQPTIASVFTALQPFQHGVRHNGAQGLSAQFETVAEDALAAGYHTSFFSGGPPIWRKSGLNQGFEIFDDHVQISSKQIYRPSRELVNLFLSWQRSEAPLGGFFSVLFIPDLQFIDAPTLNELGELRESSLHSQVDEVGSSLEQIVKELKSRKIWDNTDVFLIGTNGANVANSANDQNGVSGTGAVTNDSIGALGSIGAQNMNGALKSKNLARVLSASTRVTLMIKPARKLRETLSNWQIDSNVNLADVGATIFSILSHRPNKFTLKGSQSQLKDKDIQVKSVVELNSEVSPESYLQAVSLQSVMRGPKPDWSSERFILSESAWSSWHGFGPVRLALRKGPLLYLNDSPPILYDTFTDSFESAPIIESDAKYSKVRSEFAALLKPISNEPWREPTPNILAKLALARELWRSRKPTPEVLEKLKFLSRRHPDDSQLLGWRAVWAVRLSDWKELKAASGKPVAKKDWAFVAAKNLGEHLDGVESPCLQLFREKTNLNSNIPKNCPADELKNLLIWNDESLEQGVRDRAMDNFIRQYSVHLMSSRIAEANYAADLSWDVSLDTLDAPEMIDLILALPEMRKFRLAVNRRLAN